MSKFRIALALGLLVVVTFAFVPVASAQVGDAAAPVVAEKSFIQRILTDGGPIGWVIIILSVAALALTIQWAVNIRADKLCPPETIDELEALLEENQLEEAMQLCESEPNFVTRSLAAGLPRVNEGYDQVKESVEATAGIEAVKLQQTVGWMLFLSNVAPMLGLFGTVEGMIRAFEKIRTLGANVQPADLAEGISSALVTTFLGLVVAIPAVAIYQYFRNKSTRISIHFGEVLEEMIDRFRTAR